MQRDTAAYMFLYNMVAINIRWCIFKWSIQNKKNT